MAGRSTRTPTDSRSSTRATASRRDRAVTARGAACSSRCSACRGGRITATTPMQTTTAPSRDSQGLRGLLAMKTNKSLPSISGNGSLVRPQYFPGLLLEDEDLTSAVTYTQSIVRLALRSLFGCGVVCGLGVTAAFECERRKVKVTVQKGVALDCLGNLIEIPSAVDLVYDPECEPMPSDLWV